jgi:hypothetical protein
MTLNALNEMISYHHHVTFPFFTCETWTLFRVMPLILQHVSPHMTIPFACRIWSHNMFRTSAGTRSLSSHLLYSQSCSIPSPSIRSFYPLFCSKSSLAFEPFSHRSHRLSPSSIRSFFFNVNNLHCMSILSVLRYRSIITSTHLSS